MASEDSQHLGWFSVVHRLLDLRYLGNATKCHMPTELHQLDDPYELLEVLSLRSSQWVLSKEGHDLGAEVVQPVNVEPQEVFLVVVASSVDIDLAASEEPLQIFEYVPA